MKILLVFIIIFLTCINYTLFLYKPKDCSESETMKKLFRELEEQQLISDTTNPPLSVDPNYKDYKKYLDAISTSGMFVANENETYYVENGVSSFAVLNIQIGTQSSTLMRAKDINNVAIGELNCRAETNNGDHTTVYVTWLWGYKLEKQIVCQTKIALGQPIGVLLAGDFYSIHMNIITYDSGKFRSPTDWQLLDAKSLKFIDQQPLPFLFSTLKRLPIIFISSCHMPASINIIAQFQNCKSS